MVEKQNEHVVIEHFDSVDHVLLEPMIGAFQDSGISVRVQDWPGPQGCCGLLAQLPTAVEVIVKVLEAGGTAVAGVIAKDAYSALKRGFPGLWKNLHHTSEPGYSNRFSMKLSAICEFRDGRRLKLLLSPRSQPKDAEKAVAQFFKVAKMKLDARHSRFRLRRCVVKPRSIRPRSGYLILYQRNWNQSVPMIPISSEKLLPHEMPRLSF